MDPAGLAPVDQIEIDLKVIWLRLSWPGWVIIFLFEKKFNIYKI